MSRIFVPDGNGGYTELDIKGDPGPINSLKIGAVTTGAPGSNASSTITGAAPSQTLNLTIPRGDKGDKGDQGVMGPVGVAPSSTYELHGNGMPNGQVVANPGVYYTDDSGTNGAWRWLKKSGTDNTGWVVTYGDTGWRNITGLSPHVTGGNLYVRRFPGEVWCNFDDVNATVASGSAELVMPEGFRISGTYIGVLYAISGGTVATTFARPDNLVTSIRLNTTTVRLRDVRSYPNTEGWPAVLPGNPA